MTLKAALACGTAAAILAVGSANAATIHLVDLGVADARAAKDFQIAAAYWGSMFTNNVTIDLGVGFHSLPPHVIGSTNSAQQVYFTSDWIDQVNATKSGSTFDQNLVLPALNGAGGINVIVNGADAGGTTTSAAGQIYTTNTTTANYYLSLNTAVVKAIGGTAEYDPSNSLHLDGSVTFSSDFNFSFNSNNGVSGSQIDFLDVAIHEIGHALGFVSGVDTYDYFGAPKGPGAGSGVQLNDDYAVLSALDMFRYSNDPHHLGPGGAQLDETVGTASYFSTDGGDTALFGNSFATGAFNGDGDQASHWKDAAGCSGLAQLGIMDPTFCYGQIGVVKALDLAAFDAIGWNLTVDELAGNGGYARTTAQIYSQFANVPEPASWALMLGGFGLVGAVMRRRRIAVSFG